MQMLRQLIGSFLLALFAAFLVIGGISLALAEVYVPNTPTPIPTQETILVISSPTAEAPGIMPASPTSLPSATVPPSASCPPPATWVQIVVQAGDDLANLAVRYKTSPDEISRANCLFSDNLLTGFTLYVPPVPQPTAVPCGPPVGWVRYTVQTGNTMFGLSQAYGVSISQLQSANCVPSYQYNIKTGQTLWVPFVAATRTPLATATATLTPVSIIFPTVTGPATITLTATMTTIPSTMTATSTSTSTSTLPPTSTATIASPTTPPTATASPTAFPTDTNTPVP